METIGTTIFLNAFGDFDVMYTHSTLIHPEVKNVEELKKLYCEKNKFHHLVMYHIIQYLITLMISFIS